MQFKTRLRNKIKQNSLDNKWQGPECCFLIDSSSALCQVVGFVWMMEQIGTLTITHEDIILDC